jgi:probable F420-dependent oxidoreductase
VKVGISLPQAAPSLTARGLVAYVQTARDHGLDSVWVGDHLVFPSTIPRDDYPYIEGMHTQANLFPDQRWTEAVVTLAATAAVDDTLERGFAVMLPAQRQPVVLARQLAALHQLTAGRLVVGLGVGWLRQEYAALGTPFEERFDRLEESLRLMQAVWSGEPVRFQGRFWNVADVVGRPAPVGGTVTCWYGGNGMRLLRRLAPLVGGWLPYEPATDVLGRGREVAARARAAAGVTGEFAVGVVTRLPLGGGRPGGAADVGGAGDAALEVLTRYRDAGVDHLVVLASVGRDVEANRERIETLGALFKAL